MKAFFESALYMDVELEPAVKEYIETSFAEHPAVKWRNGARGGRDGMQTWHEKFGLDEETDYRLVPRPGKSGRRAMEM